MLHVGSSVSPETWPLRRLREGRFTAGGPVLDFVSVAGGRSQLRLTWLYGEEPRHLPRWDAPPGWAPQPDALDDFTGTFFSEEVLHAFHVVRQGDALVVRRSGRRDAPLLPLLPDVFSVAWGNSVLLGIKFVREDRRVVAIEASDMTPNEMVRRIRFERIREGR